MRVPVLTPLKHEGRDYEVGGFIELEETVVRKLRGAVGQDHVPEPEPTPESEPAGDADLKPTPELSLHDGVRF
jgi:hypothetical protein